MIEISSRLDTLEDSLNEALAKSFFFELERERDPLASAKNVVEAVRPLLAAKAALYDLLFTHQTTSSAYPIQTRLVKLQSATTGINIAYLVNTRMTTIRHRARTG